MVTDAPRTGAPGWKPSLVALDVDGTLLDPATQAISHAVRDAVRRVLDAGSQVVIATGRSVLGTLPVLTELGLAGGVALCSNGAVTVDATNGDVLAIETFDPAPVYSFLVQRLPGAIFAAEHAGTRSLVTSRFRESLLHGPQHVATIDELIGAPVPRLIAYWPDHSAIEVHKALDGAQPPVCTYTLDESLPWITVVPDGVTKGTALEKLRTELGIPAEDTFAAGDGENDLQMLRWAAHGVAMGQAPERVKAAADEITTAVDADGLVAAIDRWFR
jgi:hydroxymethylpyrimidine pyrophosphatase-like HAD family hydrolase